MKVSLVVASGAHAGKTIPVPGAQLVIGRDEGCHLRPASPAISKKHCAVSVRDSKVYVQDFGSTNGTTVNDAPVAGEVEVRHGDRLKLGPLDFTVAVAGGKSDATPLPEALKAVNPPAGLKEAAGVRPSSSQSAAPKPAGTPAPQPAAAAGKTPPPQSPARTAPVPTPKTRTQASGGDADDAAAMLLGMDDSDDPPQVPDGNTVFDMPAVDAAKQGGMAKPEEKKEAPKPPDSSSAARDLLNRYTRRTNLPPPKK